MIAPRLRAAKAVAADLFEARRQLHLQHPGAWTQELDLRPYKETF